MNIIKKPSPHYNDRPADCPIDMIIIHAMGYPLDKSLKILSGDMSDYGQVSSHYLIDHDGTVYQFVDEDKRAWHAGISNWNDREGLNDYSIGIELLNKDENFNAPFEEKQIETLLTLIKTIQGRHPIRDDYILGHDQIAPDRKTDPGPFFPWERIRDNI